MSESSGSFIVTKNRLTRPLPMIEMVNQHYNIKIYYSDDYTKDFENKAIDSLKINCIVKSTDPQNVISIDPIHDIIDITLLADRIAADETDDIKKYLDIAKASLREAKILVSQYFENR